MRAVHRAPIHPQVRVRSVTPAPTAAHAAVVLTMWVAGATLGGAGLGRGLRAVLAGMRRGARAAPGWCEGGVAVAVGVPCAGAAVGAVGPAWVPLWAGLGVLLVAVTVTDLAHRRIPNALTVPALPVLTVLATPLGSDAVLRGLGAALSSFAVLGAVHLVAPSALGAGDVKLAAALGVALGAASWWAPAAAPVLAAVLAAVVAAGMRARSVPFGPLLAGVAWVLVASAAGA